MPRSRLMFMRFLPVFFIFFMCFSGNASESSTDWRALDDEQYRAISKFIQDNYDDITAPLTENSFRIARGLPLGEDLDEQDTLAVEEAKYALIYQAVKDHFIDYPEGAIIAALLNLSNLERPSENPFLAEHLRPDIDDDRLSEHAVFIQLVFSNKKNEVTQNPLYTGANSAQQKEIGRQLLASSLIHALATEFSMEENQATAIWNYLHAQSSPGNFFTDDSDDDSASPPRILSPLAIPHLEDAFPNPATASATSLWAARTVSIAILTVPAILGLILSKPR